MSSRRLKIWVLVAAAVILSALLCMAQEQPNSNPPSATARKVQEKAVLSDAVRVNTKAAAVSAAKQKANKAASEKNRKGSSSEDILEFRPTTPDSAASGGTVVSKGSKKGPLKGVHGTVYGSTDSKVTGTHNAGGALGASSKSGKTSIYVETDHSRTNPSR